MKYRKIEIQISDDKTFYILLEKEAWKTIGTSCLSFARRVKYKTIAAPVGTSDSYIKSYIEAPSVGAVPWNGIQTQISEISEISDAGYFLIAVYLGKLDSHFIRLCSDAWYHTCGNFLQLGKKVLNSDIYAGIDSLTMGIPHPITQGKKCLGLWLIPFTEDYDAKDKKKYLVKTKTVYSIKKP